jgi:hypothetical protein
VKPALCYAMLQYATTCFTVPCYLFYNKLCCTTRLSEVSCLPRYLCFLILFVIPPLPYPYLATSFITSNYNLARQSNIGSIGGVSAVPLVLVPQVAIGALGRMRLLPRYASHTSDTGTISHKTITHCSTVRCNRSAT